MAAQNTQEMNSSSGGLKHHFLLETIVAFTCTVKSSTGNSSIRPFNWTTVLVPVYKNWGEGLIY